MNRTAASVLGVLLFAALPAQVAAFLYTGARLDDGVQSPVPIEEGFATDGTPASFSLSSAFFGQNSFVASASASADYGLLEAAANAALGGYRGVNFHCFEGDPSNCFAYCSDGPNPDGCFEIIPFSINPAEAYAHFGDTLTITGGTGTAYVVFVYDVVGVSSSNGSLSDEYPGWYSGAQGQLNLGIGSEGLFAPQLDSVGFFGASAYISPGIPFTFGEAFSFGTTLSSFFWMEDAEFLETFTYTEAGNANFSATVQALLFFSDPELENQIGGVDVIAASEHQYPLVSPLEIVDPLCATAHCALPESADRCGGSDAASDDCGGPDPAPRSLLRRDFDEAGKPAFATGPNAVASSELREISGVTADGVTPALLRVFTTTPGTILFCLPASSESCDPEAEAATSGANGTLTPLDAQCFTSPDGCPLRAAVEAPLELTEAGQYVAAVFLVAPLDFVRDNSNDAGEMSRPVEVRATVIPRPRVTPLEMKLEVALFRPPVVLLHGLWSDRNTWNGLPLIGEVGKDDDDDPRFAVYAHDYRGTHMARFDSNALEPLLAAHLARAKARAKWNVATTQVDLVGHSMGGILARVASADRDYRRESNLFTGDLRKTISLATPHAGSPLANVLDEVQELRNAIERLFSRKRVEFPWRNGAIQDLRIDSDAIANLPATQGPAHAITAVGGSDAVTLADTLLDVADEAPQLRVPAGILRVFRAYYSTLFEGDGHDLIVGVNSQRGGLGGSHTNTPLRLSPSCLLPPDFADCGNHMTVTKELRVSDYIADLLNSPTKGPHFAGGFPPNAQPRTSGIAQERSLGSAGLLSRSSTGSLAIETPEAGAIVRPGEEVEVRLAANGGLAPERLLLASAAGVGEIDSATLAGSLIVPPDLGPGPLEVQAFAFDGAGGVIQSQVVPLTVVVDAAILEIDAQPAELVLLRRSQRGWLDVFARYDDGVIRDIAMAEGITYTSSDPSVCAVDAQGIVTARSAGTASVTVEGAGQSDAVQVIVYEVPEASAEQSGWLAAGLLLLLARRRARHVGRGWLGLDSDAW